MGRPPLPLGTYGQIRFRSVGHTWRARALYRDYDGITREVQRHAATQGAAKRLLVEAMRDRTRYDNGGDIRSDTKVSDLAEAWFTSLGDKDRSATTLEAYRYRLDRQIVPALGELRVRELTPGVIDRHLSSIGRSRGPSTAKICRTILSGMCGLATRHDALDRNPVRDAGIISTSPKSAPRALSVAEVRQLRAFLTYDRKAVERDLPDFVGFMIATGLRIGEAAAVTWDAIDLDTGAVTVRGTVIRIKGQGLSIKPAPKSKAGARTLLMPSWCIEMLRRRARTSGGRPGEAAFPAPLSGALRDPSNTQAGLKDAFTWAGVPWVSSHTLRKTVATLMDEAGLSARAAADQLGHAKPSMTTDVYFGRKTASTGAAAVLEALS